MRTTISVRTSAEVPDPVRARAGVLLDRLSKLSPGALEATVVFDMEFVKHTAEIRLHARGGHWLVATGSGRDHRSALDRTAEKLKRQLTKTAALPRSRRRSQARRA